MVETDTDADADPDTESVDETQTDTEDVFPEDPDVDLTSDPETNGDSPQSHEDAPRDVKGSPDGPTPTNGETGSRGDPAAQTQLSEEKLREMARDLARAQVQEADGRTKLAKARAAIETLRERFQSLSRQLQEVREAASHWERQVEGTQTAVDYLEDIGKDPDRDVTRELHDGVVVDVPPEERGEFVDDLRVENEQAQENLDELEDHTQKVAQELAKTKIAVEELEETCELIDDSGEGDEPIV